MVSRIGLPGEHREDAINRLFADPLADKIRLLLKKGVTFEEIVCGLRAGLWHGLTEWRMSTGIPPFEAEKIAYKIARETIPEIERAKPR